MKFFTASAESMPMPDKDDVLLFILLRELCDIGEIFGSLLADRPEEKDRIFLPFSSESLTSPPCAQAATSSSGATEPVAAANRLLRGGGAAWTAEPSPKANAVKTAANLPDFIISFFSPVN